MSVPNPSFASKFLRFALLGVLLLAAGTVSAKAQSAEDAVDVVNYNIDAEIIPDTQTLRATAAVTIKAVRPVQSVTLEMNGSLEISRVTGSSGEPLQFVQDRLKDLNVRIALGQTAQAGQEFTLTFDYAGQLISSDGGVLAIKRLAYIGKEGCYLTYAARWFPFHAYAADFATYTISLVAPNDLKVVAFGEHTEEPYVAASAGRPTGAVPSGTKTPPTPPTDPRRPGRRNQPTPQPAPTAAETQIKPPPTGSGPRTRHTFRSAIPVLPGTVAAGQYQTRTLKRGDFTVEFFVKPGNEEAATRFGDISAEAGEFLAGKFGNYAFGNKLQIAEIDNESLETYTTAGVTLLATKLFERPTETMRETLVRETAYQWWGQAVGLKTFDDVWLSQGLATFSYMLLEQSRMKPGDFSELSRDFSERALAFESQTSIARAPAELDDQSAAYRSIVYYKGAFVFRMLQILMTEGKFARLMRTYYDQNRGGRPGIRDFESLATKIHGEDLRYFFSLWVDSTGVPEFTAEYQIIRTKAGEFRIRGTVEQNLDNFKYPVDIALEHKGGLEKAELVFNGKSADFVFTVKDEPGQLVIDPDSKILRMSEEVRVAVVVRRGIQHMQAGEFAEAQQQFEAAAKLNRRSSWAFYNLGLLFMRQQNYRRAVDAFSESLDGDLRPSWLEVWSYLQRGNAYDAQGQRDRAVAEYKKVAELGDNPENVQEQAQKYLSTPFRPERGATP